MTPARVQGANGGHAEATIVAPDLGWISVHSALGAVSGISLEETDARTLGHALLDLAEDLARRRRTTTPPEQAPK